MKQAFLNMLQASILSALIVVSNAWADSNYSKMDFGFNGCDIRFGPIQRNVTEDSMAKMAAATNANGFTYTPVYNYGAVLIGQYPMNCKSPANQSWPLYLKTDSTIPEVTQLSTQKAPTPPSGMKVTCMTGSNSPTPDGISPTCPVITYNGVDFWPFSYIDNRISIGLVGYKAGQVVKQLELKGTRYAWDATVDVNAKTVSVWGQGSSASTSWASLQ